MNKIKVLVFLWGVLQTAGALNAQMDTINMFPYARIIVRDDNWFEKNKQSNELIRNRLKLLNKNNPTQSIRFKVEDYEGPALREVLEKRLNEKYGAKGNSDLETTFELVQLRADLMQLILIIKPNECTNEREEFLSLIGEGIEMHMFMLDLGNHQYLELEPDNENFSVQSFRDLNSLCKEIALNIIPLTPEKADSVLRLPMTREVAEKALNDCLSDTSAASSDLLLRKMYCLTPEAIREELNSTYTNSVTDSLYQLNDPKIIEKYYVQLKKVEEFNRKFNPIFSKYIFNYSYSEHFNLKRKQESLVYPLEEYLNAIFGISSANDLCRLSTLNHLNLESNAYFTLTQRDGNFKIPDQVIIDPLLGSYEPIAYNEATFFKALEASILKDTSHIVAESHNLLENGIWLTLETSEKENKQFLFQLSNGKWTNQEMSFTTKSGTDEIWTINELSTPTLTIFQLNDDLHYFIHSTKAKSEWIEINPSVFDSTKYIQINKSVLHYDGLFNDSKTNLQTLKSRNLYESFVKHFLPDAKSAHEIETLNYSDFSWIEIKADAFVSGYTVESALESELAPCDKIKLFELEVMDLDNDSIQEIFHYALSNGEIVSLEMFRETKQGIVKVKNSEAKKLLMSNNNFRHRLIDSMKGNFEGYKFLKKE